ncbi:MAG TPA: zinc-ribbon domain-containing protein [Isosphaeraceae bacterium]|jgi:hypothetical protein|nr:zinc-ribbon domain-containing protein [Isosphaeraceae bacterium]
MFILVWGSRVRVIDLGSGDFHCPECDQSRTYSHRRVARYFTLFWIPLFPTANLGEYVECRTCGLQYTDEILSYTPPSPSERAARRARLDLDSGMPTHMVERKLIGEGLKREDAESIVAAALGDDARVCQDCGFIYRASVRSCSNCGGELEELETLP